MCRSHLLCDPVRYSCTAVTLAYATNLASALAELQALHELYLDNVQVIYEMATLLRDAGNKDSAMEVGPSAIMHMARLRWLL